MSMKTVGLFIMMLVLMALTVMMTEKAVSARYASDITRLKGEVEIYKAQAYNYSKVLRSIRETAATATPIEKAQ